MSNPNIPSFADFGKLVPGFDFLQNLSKQAAGSAAESIPQLPNLGNWIAPTLNVEELDKRIQELKSVQFWLDQNAAALKATIQALEVQKMTLATLKGMNFNMGDVANAFKLKVADSMADGVQRVTDKVKEFSGQDKPAAEAPGSAKAKADKGADAASSFADPMQWWGALTQQFQVIAADAMKETAKRAAFDAGKNVASEAVKAASGLAKDMAKGMAESASKTMASAQAAKTVLHSVPGWPVMGAAPAAAAPAKPKRKPAAKAAAKPAVKVTAKAAAKTPARKAAARKTTR